MGRINKIRHIESKKIEISLTKKNILVRSIIVIGALLLATILLTNSCSKMLNKSTYISIDYPEIINLEGEKEILFDGEIAINYYYNIDKEKDSKKNISNKIKTILNDNLVLSHQLLDSDDGYPENNAEMHNIYYINNHPNTWISVNKELYDTLLMAIEISNDTDGKYSPFSGCLYQIWNELFLSYSVNGNNTPSTDPVYSETISDSISKVIDSINDGTASIEFNEENYQVKFNVDNTNLQYIKLDLGLLKHAILIDKLEGLLVGKGFDSGMITSTTGIAVSLGNDIEDGYSQINSVSYQTIYNDNNVIYDYSFAFNGYLKCMMFNPFLNINFNSLSNKNYYWFNHNSDIIMRTMILDSTTGYTSSNTHSTFTFSIEDKLVDQLKDNYNMFFSNSYDNYLLKYKDSQKTGAMIVFNDGNTNIEYDGNTTLLCSTIAKDYFKEDGLPYIQLSAVVKDKRVVNE